MAFEVERKRISDSEDFNDFALGLKLPIKNGNGGYFEQNFTTIEQTKSNLLNLLKTKQGERIIHTTFGSRLDTLIFEQMDTDDFGDRIFDEINSAIKRWLPYVTIENLDIDLSDSNVDSNKVNIKLYFKVGKDIDTEFITFTIEQ